MDKNYARVVAAFSAVPPFLPVGGAALAATVVTDGNDAMATGRQAVSIGVKPDAASGFAFVVHGTLVAPGNPMPNGQVLPPDFAAPAGCALTPTASPIAMVVKGIGKTQTYTLICASAAPATVRETLAEGFASR